MGGFGDYYGVTFLHPWSVTATALLALFVLTLPARLALLPLLMAATTLPMAQRVVIAGADFTLLRILLLVYVVRVLLRGEYRDYRWNVVDGLVLLWALSSTVFMTINYGSFDAFLNRLGWSYDLILTYFLGRVILSRWDNVLGFAKGVVFISIPVAAIFIHEWNTQQNLFHVFGSVPEYTRVTEGRIRCQGPFPHSIIAGAFWAALLPVIWLLWREPSGGRMLSIIGTICALIIVATTSSSTSVLTVLAAVTAVIMFPFRRQRTMIWVGIVAIAFVLHFFIMKQPIWHLMARADILAGSTGWHRFVIFDAFVNNFSRWYLVGESDPLSWGVWQMRDITNYYISQGLRGGLATLLVFLLVLIYGFRNVGKSLTLSESSAKRSDPVLEWRLWLLGVALFSHVVTFFGVSYFGQIIVVWYLQLALVGSAGVCLSQRQVSNEPCRDKPLPESRTFLTPVAGGRPISTSHSRSKTAARRPPFRPECG